MRWEARRRFVAAGAGALAVHLLLAWLVAKKSAPLPPPHTVRPPMAVVLVETPPKAPAVPEPTETPPVDRRRTQTKRVAPKSGVATVNPGGVEAPAPAPGPAAPGGQGGGDGVALVPWTQPWLKAEGLGKGTVGTKLGDEGLDVAPGAPDGPVVEKSREQRLAEEKQQVTRQIQNWSGDVAAKDRARTAPDHYWRGVGDVLARGFDPGWDILDKGPNDSGGKVRSQFWESWKRQAEAYGKTGSPMTNSEPRPSLNTEFLSMNNDDRGLGSVSLGGAPTAMINFDLVFAGVAGTTFTRKLVAMVKVTQREDGSIFAVELQGSSGNPSYDRLAVQQAHKLDALHLGPPKQGKATLWAFESTFSQIPPVPIAGCALDDFIPKHCWYPLQKLAKSRVTLVAIY